MADRFSGGGGSGGGVTSLGSVGNSPNANAGVIAGSVLTLEPADDTHPGVVSVGTQTFGGNKTIDGTLTVGVPASPTTFATDGSGNLTITPSGTQSTFVGNLIVGTANSIVGTATNNNAAAGNVGEYTTGTIASGSAVSLTTATAANVTSISLTAGDWDITGVIDYILTGATTSAFQSGSSSTSATFGGQDTYIVVPSIAAGLSATYGQNIPTNRFLLSAPTTIYLVAQATFSVGTITAYGTIRARRMR